MCVRIIRAHSLRALCVHPETQDSRPEKRRMRAILKRSYLIANSSNNSSLNATAKEAQLAEHTHIGAMACAKRVCTEREQSRAERAHTHAVCLGFHPE